MAKLFISPEIQARLDSDRADKLAKAMAALIRKDQLKKEALEAVIAACNADCGLSHIEWLAKQGLK